MATSISLEFAPADGSDTSHSGSEAYPMITASIIPGATPRERKIGAPERPEMPSALREALFGVERSGHSFAVLDAAKLTNLPERLEQSGLPFCCLYHGNAYEQLKNVSPWLVQLEENNAFTRNLFTAGTAPWFMWDQNPGIFLRVDADINELRKHLRKFTQVLDTDGRRIFFRFWEPDLIVDEVLSSRWSMGSLISFLSLSDRNCMDFIGRRQQTECVILRAETAHVRPRLNVYRKGLADWYCIRKIKTLSKNYNIQYRHEVFERYSGEYWKADDIDLELLTLLHGYFGNVPRYHFNQDDSEIGQSRKRDFLLRLQFMKRQGIRYGL